jgi:nitrate/nitrite transporter NarK
LFLAFYYQLVRGWSPLQSGTLLLPFAVGQLLGAPRSGKMVDLFGARKVISAGLAIAVAAMFLLAILPEHAGVWYLILTGLLFGFGLGNVFAPSVTRMTLATPPAHSGSGAAVQNTVRQVGAAFGVAILSSVVGTVYSSRIDSALARTPVPPAAKAAARDSIGATYEVASRAVAQGAPQSGVASLLRAANDAFMPGFHAAAFVALGLLVLAIILFVALLPARPDTVAWSSTGEEAPDSAAPPRSAAAPDAATDSDAARRPPASALITKRVRDRADLVPVSQPSAPTPDARGSALNVSSPKAMITHALDVHPRQMG